MKLPTSKLLTRGPSYDPVSVSVPIPRPDVTTALKLPRLPAIALPDTELTDVHAVLSHPVSPSALASFVLDCRIPKLAPDMVMLSGPAVARFSTATLEGPAPSYEATCDVEPTPTPAVRVALSVDLAPVPTLQVTVDVDSHPVAWHDVWPTLVARLYPDPELAAPVIVMVRRPSDIAATLMLPTTDVSYDPASVTLHDAPPAVTTTLRLAEVPAATRHVTTLPDTHPVPSHPVAPILPCTLYDPAPLTVRLP
eukprot:645707-Rhodomonas_salina.1